MHSILAVDPGGTTGLAWCDSAVSLLKVEDERMVNMISLGQIQGSIGEQAWKIHLGMLRLGVSIVVVETSDHFLLQAHRRQMRKHSLIPVEMCGAIKAIVEAKVKQGTPVVLAPQTASQGKSVMTDERMAALGFEWKRGDRHQIDAARHLITFLRRVREGSASLPDHTREALEGVDWTWVSRKPVRR